MEGEDERKKRRLSGQTLSTRSPLIRSPVIDMDDLGESFHIQRQKEEQQKQQQEAAEEEEKKKQEMEDEMFDKEVIDQIDQEVIGQMVCQKTPVITDSSDLPPPPVPFDRPVRDPRYRGPEHPPPLKKVDSVPPPPPQFVGRPPTRRGISVEEKISSGGGGLFSNLSTTMTNVFSMPSVLKRDSTCEEVGSGGSLTQVNRRDSGGGGGSGEGKSLAAKGAAALSGFFGGFGWKSAPPTPPPTVKKQVVQAQPPQPELSLPEYNQVGGGGGEVGTDGSHHHRSPSGRRRLHARQMSVQSSEEVVRIQYLTPEVGRKKSLPNEGGERGGDGSEDGNSTTLDGNSRQSSFLQSEYGSLSMESGGGGDASTRDEKNRERVDEDSAFCSTNGRSSLVDEEPSSAASISPLPKKVVMSDHQVISEDGEQRLNVNQEGDEKRDSIGSNSGGFQNRFASIMKAKVAERRQRSEISEGSQDVNEGTESMDVVSDLPQDVKGGAGGGGGDQDGVTSSTTPSGGAGGPRIMSKKGRTKWIAAVVSLLAF